VDNAGPAKIDMSRPHSARVYDYLLGGKDNFAADREVAERAIAAWPAARAAARGNRVFLGRAVRYLAGEAGITQFLDLGSGLPSAGNVHEVAQDVNPAARVVYVDNDPIVLVHSRALLVGNPLGACEYIQEDIKTPQAIFRNPATRATLDFGRPVALLLVAVLHFFLDEEKPGEIADLVFTGLSMVPPGVVPISEWRPEPGAVPPPRAEVGVNGGVARKL
jgi:S-adenosyl methyltransferase